MGTKSKIGKALIISGSVLWALQILSIIGRGGISPIFFDLRLYALLRGAPAAIGYFLGVFCAALVGTILIIIGNVMKAGKGFDKKTDILCKSCQSLLPKGAEKCNVCGTKIDNH